MTQPPTLRTFRQFSEIHPAFGIASLRWLRFNERTNGFERAFVSVGSRVLVNEAEFFRIIDEENGRGVEAVKDQ